MVALVNFFSTAISMVLIGCACSIIVLLILARPLLRYEAFLKKYSYAQLQQLTRDTLWETNGDRSMARHRIRRATHLPNSVINTLLSLH